MRDKGVLMFGYSRLFRSRWSALIWAAGILWFAVEVWSPDDPDPVPDGNLQNILE